MSAAIEIQIKPYYEDTKSGIVIYNADCREVLPYLPKVDLVLTDPPYGVGAKYGPSYDDDRDAYWQWFLPCLVQIRAAATVVAFTHRVAALRSIPDWDWVGVWNKPYSAGTRLGNSAILPHWEPIFLFGIHSMGTVSEYMSDVLTENPNGNGLINGRGREGWAARNGCEIKHPTPKPLNLLKSLASKLSPKNGTVLDPFMGSGTTLRAAKDLGRKAIGIEIEERYCEIAANRLRQEVLQF